MVRQRDAVSAREFEEMRKYADRSWPLVAFSVLLAMASPLCSQAKAQASGNRSASDVRVSQDLLDLYQTTPKMSAESEFTELIQKLEGVLADPRRHKADRDYAAQLLAWGANKRGEVRCDRAGEFAAKNELEKARKLDQSALIDFQISLKHDPSRWKAKQNMGVVLAMLERREEALQAFSEVIELNPKFPGAYFNRAAIYSEFGENSQAISDLSTVLQLDPQDAEAYHRRARLRMRGMEFENAIADFRKAAELAPKQLDYLVDYADACQSASRWKDALIAYKQVLTREQENLRALQNSAWLLATCPDPQFRDAKTALAVMQRVKSNGESRDYQILDVEAAAKAAAGDFAAAASLAMESARNAPSNERDEIEARAALYKKRRAYLQPTASSDANNNAIARSGNAPNSPETKTSSERTLQVKRPTSMPVGTGVR